MTRVELVAIRTVGGTQTRAALDAGTGWRDESPETWTKNEAVLRSFREVTL